MGLRYFDRNGRAISRSAWQALSAHDGYAHVADHELVVDGRRVLVATYWLGVTAKPASAGRPLIFHTVVPGHPDGHLVWGWPTLSAARDGHLQVVRWLTGSLPDPPSGRLGDRPHQGALAAHAG